MLLAKSAALAFYLSGSFAGLLHFFRNLESNLQYVANYRSICACLFILVFDCYCYLFRLIHYCLIILSASFCPLCRLLRNVPIATLVLRLASSFCCFLLCVCYLFCFVFQLYFVGLSVCPACFVFSFVLSASFEGITSNIVLFWNSSPTKS